MSRRRLKTEPFRECSHEENFAWLNHKDDGTQAVKIANPKSLEFQVVRTTLLPGLLKTIRENRSHALPIKIFETSDVVFKDPRKERQARNERHAAAVWCNKTAGFEIVHGVLDRAMKMLEIPRIPSTDTEAATGYYLKETNGMVSHSFLTKFNDLNCRSDPMYFPGRAARIIYRVPASGSQSLKCEDIGSIGVLHPTVLEKFEIGYPCSALEFKLEPFRKDWQ
jgi:phenylalanyl-tRNA synthetase beta chain